VVRGDRRPEVPTACQVTSQSVSEVEMFIDTKTCHSEEKQHRQAPWKIMNWSIARITDWSIARRKQISIVPILTYSELHMIYSRHYFNCERSFVQLTTPAVSYSDRFSRKTVSTAHLAQCPEDPVFGVGVCCKLCLSLTPPTLTRSSWRAFTSTSRLKTGGE